MRDSILKDHLTLLFLIGLAFFFLYFLPYQFSKILFLIFPIAFIKSPPKKSYLWIAFLFVIIEQPGGLFYGGTRNEIYRLPLFSLFAGFSISFEQILVLTALFKAISMHQKFDPFFKKPMKFLSSYFFFLIGISALLGMGFDEFRNLYKIIVNLTLFYSVYFLVATEDEWRSFFGILLPFAFYALISQVFSLMNGHQLITFFKPEIISAQGVVGRTSQEALNRPIEMVHLAFICFFSSLFYLMVKQKNFNRLYLFTVNIIAYLTVFITGTRAWVLSMTASYLLVILLNPSKITKNIPRLAVVSIFFFIMISSVAILENQLFSAFNRIQTISLLAKGDITAGGTLGRFDQRAPILMKAFWNSTVIFGAGFSAYYSQHADGHVGFHNFLFNTGIVGTIILFYFLFQYFRQTISTYNRLGENNNYKNAISILAIFLIAVLIIHSSTQFIGYDVPINRIITVLMILYFSATIYQKAISEESSLATAVETI